MYHSMPPANPRKRPAPGSVPAVQTPQVPQAFNNAPNQMPDADFPMWNQGANTTNYTGPSPYNMNNYGGNAAMSQPQYDPSIPAPSTQLARRPISRQLVPTAQRTAYDNSADGWGGFGDETLLDPTVNGVMEENDNIELLEERAVVAKREAQSKRKQIPPFVQKLSSFLDESKNTDLIRWSDRGDSFVVLDEDEFAKTLIPELFKHNNYASFVRQLNMYGFHKRVGLSDNSMKASERKNKSPSEYYNPYFKRGHPNLLWLINKPKGGTGKGVKKTVKNENNLDDNSDEDGRDVEETYGQNYGNNQASRAISAAPESGPLQKREMAVVQSQLADIQKQQGAISNAISRLRKDHNQLYQQAVAFQTLHDRHESSINAILTFLATVYNRSLDGQGPQNIAQMFTNVIPQEQHPHQGSVVDMGDVSNQPQQHPGSLSPRRRQQRLLMAPPNSGSRVSTASPAGSTPQNQTYSQGTPRPGAIEELFESPADTTHLKIENDQNHLPQQGMMNIINNTNARTLPNDSKMEFPEMLSHFEHANGNSPLTSEQRSNMLNLIANTSSTPGSNNALISPTPPIPPSLEDLGYTQAEIDDLVRMQATQEARINGIRASIEPLSPSGSIPGMHDGSYFNGHDVSDPSNSNLDLDQFLDTGAFYNGSSPIAGAGDFNYGTFGDTGLGESHFDVGMDGAADGGRIVETAGSSEVGTPVNGDEGALSVEEVQQNGGLRSPSKRRRKN